MDSPFLQQNLAENGGSLDEVKFLARTNNIDDLNWLDELVTTSDSYSRVNLTDAGQDASKVNYGEVWDVVEQGVMYVKIDDDVVSTCLRSSTSLPYCVFSILFCNALVVFHSRKRNERRKTLRYAFRLSI